MRILDWEQYRQFIKSGFAALSKLSPETARGYTTLNAAGQKLGNFDDKLRELIAVAVAISLRCDGCIAVHTAAARQHGASEAEITEAMSVAISVNAGAAIIYSLRTLDAFSEQ